MHSQIFSSVAFLLLAALANAQYEDPEHPYTPPPNLNRSPLAMPSAQHPRQPRLHQPRRRLHLKRKRHGSPDGSLQLLPRRVSGSCPRGAEVLHHRLPDELVTWKQAAEAGAARLEDARKETPEFVLDDSGVAATIEQMSGLLAALGGSVEDGKARRDWINASFVEERLPWALGWRTSETVLEGAAFGPMAKALREYAPGGV
ncbi:hypothetical protein BDP81DRAFT_476628 [Colletotrichum phormii]|uniref:Uncharacterized protein n=1 Tax=Colletotrichum phormii TaxID=359342 RepID=A0AAJ0E8X1_9PEZI|nr:uncharacterized protein BDP81DRAFT_476628 [Colletotrichum phormii]KAK1622110.1 hypothetical protein BDP81DRAFT_476628 [Colletotrichum phormii]